MAKASVGPAKPKKLPAAQLIGLDHVRTRLAVVWLGGCSLIIVIVVLQSLIGKYGSHTQEAWAWLLPTIMPTLSMIVAVLGYTALDPNQSASVVRKGFYDLAVYLSGIYLLLTLLTIVIHPLADAPPLELMTISNLWLGPIQALVASALGVLFVSRQPRPPSSQGTRSG